ncbi:bacillithiol biosynthesis cysteine-adding enzyme BshC [Alicyclobacillaceae bacterium I2511]|nr:bacillithiol biosynthesis cysteine-adding enzyme BshC [Alicyclobacillaceae bacterium I2511]
MKWSLQAENSGNPLTDWHEMDFARVSSLYDHQNPREISTYKKRAHELDGLMSPIVRTRVCQALSVHMRRLGAPAASMGLLNKLRDPRTVAVVTGQQAGLFTGPLFALYKAMSAMGLARRLEQELQRPVVPVFWVASEDHDWAEVNHAYVLSTEDEVRRIVLPVEAQPHQMIYHTVLESSAVEQVLRQVYEILPEASGKQDTLQTLRDAFVSGMSMADWFAKILLSILGEQGIILFDPCLPELRELTLPVWEQVLLRRSEIQVQLDEAYGQVQSVGIHPEVVRDRQHSTLFYVQEGRRYVLEYKDEASLQARVLGTQLTTAEWVKLAERRPQSFSANVLLRPLVQDYLLPTVAYVGGPSEVAYYPLSAGVFHALERRLPPVVLRDRVVVIPPSVRRHMEKWGVEGNLSAVHEALHKTLQNSGGQELDQRFSEYMMNLSSQWRHWAEQFESLGPQIHDLAEAQISRELAGIRRLRQKTYHILETNNVTQVRQLRHIEHWLWMDGHAQERRLSPLNLWTRFGMEWLQQLPFWGDMQSPLGVYQVDL